MAKGIINEQPLWNISIYSIDMPDYDSIKDRVVDHIKQVELDKPLVQEGKSHYQKIGPMKQRHKQNLKESWSNLFENNDSDEFNKVIDFCHSVTLQIAKRTNSNYVDTSNWMINIHESWSHITSFGGYHDYHTHPHSSWCGIFYVDIGDMDAENVNGNNRFYSPMPISPEIGLEFMAHNFHDPEAKDGKLIVFPSFVPHSALPYFGDKDRIVIAFNSVIADARDIST